jgi:hypothetical protein
METTYQKNQDISFINSIRSLSSSLLDIADKALGLQKEWNGLFGGESRLNAEVFETSNAGIVKQDIADALSVLTALNTLLDTDTNRAMVEKIRVALNNGLLPRF